MSIGVQRQGSACVLTLDGDLVGDISKEFRGLAQTAMSDGCHDFVVDFSLALTIDSQGLEALTWVKLECEEHLGMIKLCGLSHNVQKILDITRLRRRFDQYESRGEALGTLV